MRSPTTLASSTSIDLFSRRSVQAAIDRNTCSKKLENSPPPLPSSSSPLRPQKTNSKWRKKRMRRLKRKRRKMRQRSK
jgi:hypothetical protein